MNQRYLKSILHYSKRTGVFTWKPHKKSPARCVHKIKNNIPAGCLAQNGHRYIRIDKKLYLESHLAHFYVTGIWPIEIDHQDVTPDNNKWNNIRPTTRSENMANTKLFSNSTSGYKGVHYDKRRKKWRGHITVNYKTKFLGNFATAEEAHAAYCIAATKIYGKFARFS